MTEQKIGRYKMGEESIAERSVAVELTESEIYMVKALAVLARVLSKVQNGDRSCRALHKEIELKMLKALDDIKAKKTET